MDVATKQHSRSRPDTTKAPLRKAISANITKRAVLRNIENNALNGKVFKRCSTKTSLIHATKENIRRLQENLAPRATTDNSGQENRLTRIIKQTITATKSVLQNKGKTGSDQAKPQAAEAKPKVIRPVILAIPNVIVDIDRGEADPLQYNEYAADVFRHLKGVESSYTIRTNFLSVQSETNGEMRADLVDWLHRNASRFELYEETYYLAVAVVDLYLQHVDIPVTALPLLGVTALLIACKYEEISTPRLSDLAKMTQFRYSGTDILAMECSMLKALDFRVGRPVPIQFLRRYSEASRCGRLSHNLSKFFLELSLLSPDLSYQAPSLLAAAASYLALWVLADLRWTSDLEFYSGYSTQEVATVTRQLARFVQKHDTFKNQAVTKKFSGEKYLEVARIPQLSSIVACFP